MMTTKLTRGNKVDPKESGHPLRVLVVHNHYKQRGGEDTVFDREIELLRSHGCEVETYEVHNDETDGWSVLDRAVKPNWNKTQYKAIVALGCKFKPDVVHIHNFYAVLSPSVFYASRANGAAVVQTLHNFRLGCVNGLLFRDGRVCESCLGRPFAWPGIVHRCYRQSRGASLSVATMNTVHRVIGTWRRTVDAYIVMTEFARSLVARSGAPVDRLVVKPHFTPEPPPLVASMRRTGALFVGRLSPEKGIDALLQAWRQLAVPLRIIGAGPLPRTISDNPAIETLGQRSPSEVATAMREAALLVLPSVWYENFPMVLIEAFAAGLPVLASRLGAMAQLVQDQETGLLFRVGDAEDLAAKVRQAFARPEALQRMGANAYSAYRARYTPERGFEALVSVYRIAIARRQTS
jgi:glycosyltransferase involved in cell wall biosynthesis